MRTPSLLILMVSLLFTGCLEESIQPNENPLTLSIESELSTEVFMKVSLSSAEQERTVLLKRNDSTIATILMQGVDSIIIDEHLLPAKNFSYTIQLRNWSTTVQATTMDTTSHQWTWTVNQFGISQSQLNDVAIINDTLAYAVGEIHIMDSTGKYDEVPYNLIRWNGKDWTLQRLISDARILYPGSGGDSLLTVKGNSIYIFGPNDIWVSAGNVFHFNGIEWTQHRGELAGFCNKIWGSSSSNMYFVGNNGFIVHYNGATWQKLQSGTNLHIYDIYGEKNTTSNEYEIYALASNVSQNSERSILKINGAKVSTVSSYPLLNSLSSVWFVPNKYYYVVGDGIYFTQSSKLQYWRGEPNGITNYYSTSIRGNNVNDIFIVGAFGDCLHYNGATWNNFRNITALTNGSYGSISLKPNFILSAGMDNGKAVILSGKRSK